VGQKSVAAYRLVLLGADYLFWNQSLEDYDEDEQRLVVS
jgi:hypothetical protein